ncbi:hypothetical protein LIA77_06472 [Sarocladium implicatum]|nr:hypothetical protein LIA77_06472 [Sarocladium implicatum]
MCFVEYRPLDLHWLKQRSLVDCWALKAEILCSIRRKAEAKTGHHHGKALLPCAAPRCE